MTGPSAWAGLQEKALNFLSVLPLTPLHFLPCRRSVDLKLDFRMATEHVPGMKFSKEIRMFLYLQWRWLSSGILLWGSSYHPFSFRVGKRNWSQLSPQREKAWQGADGCAFCFKGVANSKIGVWGQEPTLSFNQDQGALQVLFYFVLIRVLCQVWDQRDPSSFIHLTIHY